jgi:hypothetical protein
MFFLSEVFISKFLSSADFFFVSKCLCRSHLNDAYAGIIRFAPAYFLTEKFSPSAGAHFRFIHDSIRFAGPSRAYGVLYLGHPEFPVNAEPFCTLLSGVLSEVRGATVVCMQVRSTSIESFNNLNHATLW